MALSGIMQCLVGVDDLGRALALCRDTMGLQVESDAVADAARLAFWGVAPGVAARLVELSCGGYPAGRLLLADFDPPAHTKVRVHDGPGPHDDGTDIGPKAIDFYVDPPMAPYYQKVLDLGFRARSAPILHEVGDAISEEFVFWGPGGVPLLLMVGHRHSAEHMRGVFSPQGYSEVATVSVVGADVDASRDFYGRVLGLELVQDERTEPEFLERANELTGTPAGTPIHWLLYRGAGEPSGKILVVHFVGAPTVRLHGRMRPGRLGFSLLVHACDDLDALAARLEAAGALVKPPREVAGRRRLLASGPNEEFFEIFAT